MDDGWEGDVDEENDWANRVLRMDDLRNHQGRGTAHANRLQGLAISRSRDARWVRTAVTTGALQTR